VVVERLPTVLVVDDDLANLRVFQRVFRKQYEILGVTSGPEAFALLSSRSADVAFVDYRMPDMDGIEVLTELRRANPTLVRYLLTGNCRIDGTDHPCALGLCDAVLSKPWDRADIESAIARGMAKRSR
jgi:CheY-like chemotaxis protein